MSTLSVDQVKHTLDHVALYILPGEALLGSATLYMFRATQSKGFFAIVAGAAAVSLFCKYLDRWLVHAFLVSQSQLTY